MIFAPIQKLHKMPAASGLELGTCLGGVSGRLSRHFNSRELGRKLLSPPLPAVIGANNLYVLRSSTARASVATGGHNSAFFS